LNAVDPTFSTPSRMWLATRWIGAVVVAFRALGGRLGEDRLRFIRQAALAGWFFEFSSINIARIVAAGVPLGMDIRIYYRGVQSWLATGDPWTAKVLVADQPMSYAGSPATTLLLAPSALISEDQFAILWLVLTVLSAVAIVRWLRLPFWWLLFPPTVEALYSGNPQLVILMLLLAGAGRFGAVADSIAVALKVYPIVPLLGQRSVKRVALACGLTVGTFALAPGLWIDYARQFGAISARLARESQGGYSAYYVPILLVPTVLALLLLVRRDPKAAAWLAVPALWPASELHYATFAQPVMTAMLAVMLAVPVRYMAPIAIVLYVLWRYSADTVYSHLAAWAVDWSSRARPRASQPNSG
jgi:hypothetical protein